MKPNFPNDFIGIIVFETVPSWKLFLIQNPTDERHEMLKREREGGLNAAKGHRLE